MSLQTEGAMSNRCTKAGRWRALRVTSVLWFLAAAAGCGGARQSATRGGSTSLYGFVYKVVGKDTVPVSGAIVSTDPLSDKVLTGPDGYWSINNYVTDSRYRVLAKADGLTGQTVPIDVKPGASVRAIVLIGVGLVETAWPPASSLIDKADQIRSGLNGKVRCCEQ